MSRGGRGGARGGGGMRANALPFDLDPELEAYLADRDTEEKSNKKEDIAVEYFPNYPNLPTPSPITDHERTLVQIQRSMLAQRRIGPFWTGTKDEWKAHESRSGRVTENFDPFEDAATYGRKHAKRPWRPTDLAGIKLHKRFFPKELWDVIDPATTNGVDGRPAKQRKLGLVQKSVMDRLAKFDENAEDPEAATDDEDDNPDKDNEEGEDVDGEPGDDVFEEDEDDYGGDYNAEQYFEGGEEDYEEEGGDGDEGY